MGKWRQRGKRSTKGHKTHTRTVWKYVEREVRREEVDRHTASYNKLLASSRAQGSNWKPSTSNIETTGYEPKDNASSDLEDGASTGSGDPLFQRRSR